MALGGAGVSFDSTTPGVAATRGIAGLAERDPTRIPDEALLRRMSSAQSHRGPERDGLERGPGFGCATRGAPAEADGPARPFVAADGALTVACDGAIYNAPELRDSLARAGAPGLGIDPQAIVAELYRRRGVECLHALRGMFALAVWDARERTLLLGRDRLGTKPLVWAETRRGLAFGSECKAVLAAGGLDVELDPMSIDALFQIEYAIAPRTAFRGIQTLAPGHCLTARAGEVRIECWWDIQFPRGGVRPRRSTEEWVAGLRERMEDAVRVQSRGANAPAVWLSGGLDSSAVAALVARERGAPLDVHILGHDDSALDEAARGTLVESGDVALRAHRATLRDADFAAYPRAMWHAESPTSSGVEVAWWVLSREAAADRLALSGQGVGVVLAEKWIYRFEPWARHLARLPRGARRLALSGPLAPIARRHPWGAGLLRAPREPVFERFAALTGPRDADRRARLYSAEFRERLTGARAEGPGPAAALPGPGPDHPVDRLQWVDMKTNLAEFVQQKLERVAMSRGIEIRMPFLDHEFVEYAVCVPRDLLWRDGREKWILREALRGTLPESLRLRPKRGLRAPYARWLRQPLPEFAAELLSVEAIRARGYFDAAEVERRLARHRAGVEDARDSLFGVLAVHVLDEAFVARSRPWESPPA